MEEFVQKAFSVGFTVIGLSHLLHPKRWADLFSQAKKSAMGPFLIGMLTLPAGLLIVFGHPVWSPNIVTFITLAGLGMTIKSIVYLLVPGSMQRVVPSHSVLARKFSVVGGIMTVIGAALCYQAFLVPRS